MADALLWVLGEQGLNRLRGKKAEDMVFPGSEQRARLGMAEVRLTLDNSDGSLPLDFAEVTITRRAVRSGENEYLLNGNPAKAGYGNGWAEKPSGNWWKFGFPVFYVTDMLQNIEALVSLGYGGDPRLADAIALVLEKQDSAGRWALEYDYTGKTWVDFGKKKQPNKWVTLRALRAIKAAHPS